MPKKNIRLSAAKRKTVRHLKSRRVKIAVIAPPFAKIPPKGQGGTERIVRQTAEELFKRGYKTTIFGTGEYRGSADFVQIFKKTISERKTNKAREESSRSLRIENVYAAKIIKKLLETRRKFDIIFNHARGGYLFLSLSSFFKTPIITVLHLPIFKEAADFLSSFKKPNIVTISNSQRKNYLNINYLATIYNGVNLKEFEFSKNSKDYFFYMGAMGEHKNPKDAILAAKKAKVKLILAGGKKREPYFSKEIKPLIDNKQIKYLGEVFGKKRIKLLKYAKALLFPIKWQEPFGLVMIEAMACGVPVIAYPNGAVPEIVKNKKTGFIVKNTAEMAKAIKKIEEIDRKKCREYVEKNFSVEKMVDKYEEVIKKALKK